MLAVHYAAEKPMTIRSMTRAHLLTNFIGNLHTLANRHSFPPCIDWRSLWGSALAWRFARPWRRTRWEISAETKWQSKPRLTSSTKAASDLIVKAGCVHLVSKDYSRTVQTTMVLTSTSRSSSCAKSPISRYRQTLRWRGVKRSWLIHTNDHSSGVWTPWPRDKSVKLL